MGEEMEGAVQQAAQPGLQFMGLLLRGPDCRAPCEACGGAFVGMQTEALSCGKEETLFCLW